MGTYTKRAQEYRDLYHRLHAEVDGPLDRVRRAVTDQGSDAVIVKTSDHGDLLGAHGGLHQKWFNLYDEATRVPFSIALVGSSATTGAAINDAPTSHIDIIPTLLAAAGNRGDSRCRPTTGRLHRSASFAGCKSDAGRC